MWLVNWQEAGPLVTVVVRWDPVIRGPDVAPAVTSQRGGDGRKLNRRVRPAHDDHLPRWQGLKARGSHVEVQSYRADSAWIMMITDGSHLNEWRSLMVDVVSIILSSIAVGFSIFVFVNGLRRYKRDLFLRIHEIMIGEDQYRGRQLLLSRPYDETNIEELSFSERTNISRVLATYDTLGFYLQHGYLMKENVLDMWGDPAYRAWDAAQPFVARRRRVSGLPAYPHFGYLAGLAASRRPQAGTNSRDA